MAQSRIETLLEALLNGETADIVPQSRNEAYLKALVEKGGGAQSNWLQDNPEAADYVKNRTHYTEYKTGAEILPETVITFADNSGIGQGTLPATAIIEAGKQYEFVLDGVSYIARADAIPNILVLAGDGNFFSTGTFSPDMPFLYMYGINAGTVELYYKQPGDHTVAITEMAEVDHALPEKYLPSSVLRTVPMVDKRPTYTFIYDSTTGDSVALAITSTVNDYYRKVMDTPLERTRFASGETTSKTRIGTLRANGELYGVGGSTIAEKDIIESEDGNFFIIYGDVISAKKAGTFTFTRNNKSYTLEIPSAGTYLCDGINTDEAEGEKSHAELYLIDDYAANSVSIPSGGSLLLTDSNGATWKLVVGTDGTLSTVAESLPE